MPRPSHLLRRVKEATVPTLGTVERTREGRFPRPKRDQRAAAKRRPHYPIRDGIVREWRVKQDSEEERWAEAPNHRREKSVVGIVL